MLALALLGLAAPARAADRRVLESLEVDPSADGYDIRVGFGIPVRYIRHAPVGRASTVEVQIGTVSFGLLGSGLFSSESLRPSQAGSPLVDVVYEGGRTEGPVLVLHFSRAVDFTVTQQDDLDTLTVAVRDKRKMVEAARATEPPPAPTTAPAPSAEATPTPPPPESAPTTVVETAPAPAPEVRPPATPEQAEQVASLTASARSALEAGDLDSALSQLTKALELPEAPASAEAKELLGVTREKRGQLAHAKAEYEEYLARYSEGEGAARVRQRLDALLASQLAKLPASRGETAAAPRRASTFEQYGSVSAYYRRYVHQTDSLGSMPTDSSIQTDGTYVMRGSVGGLALRGQLAGAYRFDLLEGMDENDARISAVFLDLAQIEGHYGATLGRQPGNTAGVLSRFDGIRLRRRLGDHWQISALGGLPVDYYHSDTIDTDRFVYGVAVDGEELLGGLSGQVFAVQQRAADLVDRTAIGSELRWTDSNKFVSTYLDYDVDYKVLNTALLVANWQVLPGTGLSLLFDYRKSPILVTSNAVFGQPVDDLSELEELYTNDEIRQLAEDRTPTSTYASFGATQKLGARWQLGVDVSGSKLTSTPTSGGVTGTPGTGWELAVNPQLIATGLFTTNDIASFGFRYFDGATTRTYSLLVNERYPITDKLRLAPRLRVDWRQQPGSDEFVPPPGTVIDPFFRPDPTRNGQLTVRSYLGAEYRFWKLTLDSDCGVEWSDGTFTGEASLDYSLWFGLRYDF
jgi:outer membrane biosynthesis protein TonB